jgi:ferric iron reductase protein FhuF
MADLELSDPDPLVRNLVEAGMFTYIGRVLKDVEVVPCQRYLEDDDALRAAWAPVGADEAGGGEDPVDPRAAASMWSRFYVSAIATWPLMVLPAGIAVATAADRCAVVLEDRFPQRLRATSRRVDDPDQLRAEVFHGMFARHLAPLVDHMLRLVKLDPRVLWSNVGESIEAMYDVAMRRLTDPSLKDALAADRNLLLTAERLPGVDGPNPIRGTIWYEQVETEIYPGPVHVREMCCICFHIRTPTVYCRDCPMVSAKERATLYRDHHLGQWRDGAKGAPFGRDSLTASASAVPERSLSNV